MTELENSDQSVEEVDIEKKISNSSEDSKSAEPTGILIELQDPSIDVSLPSVFHTVNVINI